MCISETHTDAANRTTRSAGSPVVGGCIHSTSGQRWQHFHDAAQSRQCDKMRRSIMSIATRLGDWSGRGHVGDQAEAGGACSSEHCSCWSHAELRHPFAKCPSLGTRSPVQASIPGGYVAAVRQRRRPMSRALGDFYFTGSTQTCHPNLRRHETRASRST